MTSAVDVVNIALAEIGSQSTISSFQEDSAEANAAALLYQPKIDALLRAAPWAFARKQVFLTQLKAVLIDGVLQTDLPPQPWYYEYAYPSDCIRVRYLLPNFNYSSSGISIPPTTATSLMPFLGWNGEPIRFQIATDLDADDNTIRVLLTNLYQAQAVYTSRIDNPDLWDPSFLQAATSYLGVWFIQALARDRGGLRDQLGIMAGVLKQARADDGNEASTSMDNTPDFILARGAGGTTANLNFIGYEPLAWPGGTLL